MKKLLKITLITAALALAFNPLYGGAGHDHKHGGGHSHSQDIASKEAIQDVAFKQVLKYVELSKIDKSWAEAKVKNITKKVFNKQTEWVLSFENLKIKDKEKQIIYVFIDLYGDVIAANFTGK